MGPDCEQLIRADSFERLVDVVTRRRHRYSRSEFDCGADGMRRCRCMTVDPSGDLVDVAVWDIDVEAWRRSECLVILQCQHIGL